jgi:hypothetical protein
VFLCFIFLFLSVGLKFEERQQLHSFSNMFCLYIYIILALYYVPLFHSFYNFSFKNRNSCFSLLFLYVIYYLLLCVFFLLFFFSCFLMFTIIKVKWFFLTSVFLVCSDAILV